MLSHLITWLSDAGNELLYFQQHRGEVFFQRFPDSNAETEN